MIFQMTKLGDLLEGAMKMQNIKAADITRATGVDGGTISRILNDGQEPTVITLFKITSFLHVSMEDAARALVGLPSRPGTSPGKIELDLIHDDLPEDGKDDLLDYARGRLKRYGRTKRDMGQA